MTVILAVCLLAETVLLFAGRNCTTEGMEGVTKYNRIFYAAGSFLYKKGLFLFRRRGKAEKYLELLYPRENPSLLAGKHYGKKLGVLCQLGCMLTVLLFAYSALQEYEKEINSITRQEADSEIRLKACAEKWQENITFSLPQREYTEQELEELFSEILSKLDAAVLGENQGAESVCGPLCFVDSIEGYPFAIRWETEDSQLIKADGTVCNEEVPADGQTVKIKAYLTCQEFKRQYSFYVLVVPPVYTEQEEHSRKLYRELERENAEQKAKKEISLPEKVEGEKIAWYMVRENNAVLLAGFGAMALLLCWKGEDEKLKKKIAVREKALSEEYPEIISKLTLLLGAGLPIREAVRRISTQKGGVAYEEMAVIIQEMEAGVSEGRAYLQWGKRCRLGQYRKLSTLLVQNLKKGSRGLLLQLENEAESALEEKRSGARKLGEEAGTKLLIPMMGMLLVVMIFIIVPAFGNF